MNPLLSPDEYVEAILAAREAIDARDRDEGDELLTDLLVVPYATLPGQNG